MSAILFLRTNYQNGKLSRTLSSSFALIAVILLCAPGVVGVGVKYLHYTIYEHLLQIKYTYVSFNIT